MARSSSLACLIALLAFGFACVSSGGEGEEPAKAAAPQLTMPADSPLAKIELGMNDEQVRAVLGSPDDSNSYTTGKAWIPYYYGPDTSRSDWLYKDQSRVVFSRNRYTGGLKVIRVTYNPNDSL